MKINIFEVENQESLFSRYISTIDFPNYALWTLCFATYHSTKNNKQIIFKEIIQ